MNKTLLLLATLSLFAGVAFAQDELDLEGFDIDNFDMDGWYDDPDMFDFDGDWEYTDEQFEADIREEFGPIFADIDEDGDGAIPGKDIKLLFSGEEFEEEDWEEINEFIDFSGLAKQATFDVDDFVNAVMKFSDHKEAEEMEQMNEMEAMDAELPEF